MSTPIVGIGLVMKDDQRIPDGFIDNGAAALLVVVVGGGRSKFPRSVVSLKGINGGILP